MRFDIPKFIQAVKELEYFYLKFVTDMRKIELEIVALSHSITQSNSYAVVLGEVNGLRRLPIVIGGFEAQAIAVALEKMKPTRPLTHDLMKNFMLAFNVDLHEVIISDLLPAFLVIPVLIVYRKLRLCHFKTASLILFVKTVKSL
jgi:CO dehydrogenase/acetyl-CoA synthase gamma subunit (corrinoid Fe-S protein)